VYAPPELASPTSVWASGRTDVWLLGQMKDSSNAAFHFDGGAWTRVDVPKGGDFSWGPVAGTGPKDVWIGTMHYDGTDWTPTPGDSHVGLSMSLARGQGDIYTVSAMGEILHCEAARCSLISTVARATNLAIVGSDLLGTGLDGTIVRKKL
jgi:hypothetical protein